ncbi:riboflavin synthase [Bacillus massiliigorillae]|uniref:riboflavin synthase n=1 Tax=Bacillus massiliigorillae TaxID=1243664 RepID=UPI0003A2CB62|nr:riboflavin synthase [Bacillus massiliigorillae]
MFTGIVEDMGKVSAMTQGPNSMQLTIQSSKIVEDVHLGDSIAVNGVCLTVISFTKGSFTVDVMPETVKATSIQSVRIGSVVNLERAMSANGRFGGHFVSGHVDGTGIILRKQKRENAVYIDIRIDESISKYCIPKGSIAIDGISLTIFGIEKQKLTVSLIPHTYEKTLLGLKKENDVVNIENDLLGKYVIHQMERNHSTTTISKEFLLQNGF